jgi:ERF superfamily
MSQVNAANPLAVKLAEVYKNVEAIVKMGRNKSQGYDYVRAADVVIAIRKQLIAQSVYAEINFEFVGQPYTVARAKEPAAPFSAVNVKCSIVFHDLESSYTLTGSGLGSGCDNSDKAVYKAQTGAIKYALRSAFLIPDEFDPERDESVDEPNWREAVPDYAEVQGANRSQQAKPAPRPIEASAVELQPVNEAPARQVEPPSNEPASIEPTSTNSAASTQSEELFPEEPVTDTLPTPDQMVEYRTKISKIADDLSLQGKLKASQKLPVNRKLLTFLLSITGRQSAKAITNAQWFDFFARVERVATSEHGYIGLAKLVNQSCGIDAE